MNAAIADDEEADLSALDLYFECPKAGFVGQSAVKLIPDPQNAKGQLIFLTLEQVEKLPSREAEFAIRDLTGAEPGVIVAGLIQRVGFVGEIA